MFKRSLLLIGSVLILAACTDTTGLSKESSRAPLGNPSAAVIVTEFADLQCPACQAAHGRITKPIVEEYGDQIAFHIKHFPLQNIHRYALEAAMAAECAADQDAFWEYVDTIYENQSQLSVRQMDEWAAELGLDTELFTRCRESNVKRDTVLADYEEGREAGVGGTPTYFVNGQQVPATYEAMSQAIETAIDSTYQRL